MNSILIIFRFSISVCYSIIFNGRRLSHRYIERSVSVISLDECKLLCTRETSFDCRSFNYRYFTIMMSNKEKFIKNIFVTLKRRRLSSTNCDLSREDSASLDVTSSRVFFSDSDVDFYQRVGRGQSCYRPYGRPPLSPVSPTSSSSLGNEYYYGSISNSGSLIQRPSSSIQPAISTSINGIHIEIWMFQELLICFIVRMLSTIEIWLSSRAENRSWLAQCPKLVRVPGGMSPLPHFCVSIV
jgi:hypothetical protein